MDFSYRSFSPMGLGPVGFTSGSFSPVGFRSGSFSPVDFSPVGSVLWVSVLVVLALWV